MGLDHGLRGSISLWTFEEKDKEISDKIRELFPGVDADVESVSFDLLTLRKANAIHNWFVKNVQEGNDNCETYWVSEENLKELKDLCGKALFGDYDSMPTTSGFFFGDTNYGEWYEQGLRDTINGIDAALKFLKLPKASIEYWSSW